MLQFQTDSLKNGLRVITAPMHDTGAVSVLFLVGVGSRYETSQQAGLSHFLEHMVFKGTKKRPTNLQISTELDGVGAQYNAYTSEEYTGFWIRASADQFPLALDILTDLLWGSIFPAPELEREKGVIIEELNMYRDTPQSHVADLAKQTLFPNSSLGHNVAGFKETVKSFKQADFINYRDTFYRPENVILAVAGNPLKINWLPKIETMLKNLPSRATRFFSQYADQQIKPRVTGEFRPTDQAHFILALPKFKRTDRRWPIVKVMVNLLGGMMSSRLFVEVREKRGLAYYINAGADDYHDTGAFYVRAGVDTQKIDEAVKVVLVELDKLKAQPVDEAELTKTKANLKGGLYLGLEDSLSVTEFLADQALLWGSIDQPEQIVDEYMKVTADDIIKVARELFVTEKLNLAVVGPYKEEEKFLKLLKI